MSIIHVSPDHKKLLDEIHASLNKAKRIVAVTGAGISTNCGIPDFRSKEGLYNLVDTKLRQRLGSKNLSVSSLKGKDLFSSTLWQDEDATSVFYNFIATLKQRIKNDVRSTSQTHKLIRRIRDQKKLLRCYTQNIDGLEAREDLSLDTNRGKGSRGRFSKKCIDLPNLAKHNVSLGKMDGGCEVVQLHGDLETVRCTICQRVESWTTADSVSFLRGEAPHCLSCQTDDAIRQASGKRGSVIGTLRPNIVLYGEPNPLETEIGALLAHDLSFGPDLLLVMGTSLKVHGLKAIVKEFAKAVHSKKNGKVVFINMSEPAKSTWKGVIDYWVETDCDEWSKDKLLLNQKEIAFPPAPKTTTQSSGKENIPSTPCVDRILKPAASITPPPPSAKRTRILAELDPISATARRPMKRARLQSAASQILVVDTQTQALHTPPSSQRGKKSQGFRIWAAEEGNDLEVPGVVPSEASPLKGRKARIL